MDEILDSYMALINPHTLVQTFDSMQEFEDWANIGTKEDVQCALDKFEEQELFEHCAVLKQVIDRK